MHPVSCSLPGTYEPVRVTLGALVYTLVHLCTSSLQNLVVTQDFYYLVSISAERFCYSVFDGVGQVGFNAFLLA